MVYTQVLVGTPSIDFSEKGNETQLIYSGLVLLDQPSQGFKQFTKIPNESKTTCKLQGQLTQTQSLTNLKSYQTLVQRKESNEKYVMITN